MKLTEESRETIRRIDETRRTTPTPDVVAGAAAAAVLDCWWGKITSFTAGSGLGKAKKVTGSYPNFNAPAEGEPEVDVIIGIEAMHYCPQYMSRHGHFISSGAGVTPIWTLNQHVRIGYAEPTAPELHDEQDDGGGLETCGA